MSEVMEKDTLAGEQTQTAEAQQAADDLLKRDGELASCPLTALYFPQIPVRVLPPFLPELPPALPPILPVLRRRYLRTMG